MTGAICGTCRYASTSNVEPLCARADCPNKQTTFTPLKAENSQRAFTKHGIHYPKFKRCPACLGHGVVPIMPGAGLSTRQPPSQADGSCAMCQGKGVIEDTVSGRFERLTVEKLSIHFGVTTERAQAAIDDLGFLYREIA